MKFKLFWESVCYDIKWGESRKYNFNYILKREIDMGIYRIGNICVRMLSCVWVLGLRVIVFVLFVFFGVV